MAVPRHDKRAPLWGALFALALAVAPAWSCPLDHADESAAVAHIYDGDTIRLQDGRKVRFIGINTPEIHHDGSPSEPYSQVARNRLQALLASGKVLLRYDTERKDRYGRLLAHPYLADGSSISRILLDEGLAAAVVIPPNLWQNDCYLSHERKARSAGRGIWSARGHVVKRSDRLQAGDQGFALLQGRVDKFVERRQSLWLEMAGGVALHLPRKDLDYFTSLDLRGLVGHDVEARGWLTYHKGKWRMTVHHPAALRTTVGDNLE